MQISKLIKTLDNDINMYSGNFVEEWDSLVTKMHMYNGGIVKAVMSDINTALKPPSDIETALTLHHTSPFAVY